MATLAALLVFVNIAAASPGSLAALCVGGGASIVVMDDLRGSDGPSGSMGADCPFCQLAGVVLVPSPSAEMVQRMDIDAASPAAPRSTVPTPPVRGPPLGGRAPPLA